MLAKSFLAFFATLGLADAVLAEPMEAQVAVDLGQGSVLYCQSAEDAARSQLAYRLSEPEVSLVSNRLSASMEVRFLTCRRLTDGTYAWEVTTPDQIVVKVEESDRKNVLIEERNLNPELLVVDDSYGLTKVVSLSNKSVGRVSFQVDLNQFEAAVADAGGVRFELSLRTTHEYRLDGGEWLSTGYAPWNGFILKAVMAPTPAGLKLLTFSLQ